eukprot:gnl/TRDRNA2_/TRDRNA2_202624_c0_seq1.p1 gnl/TRDRNA2_/TRDRNA2_202624_c0~~gnl/TRDRNA2_/TRDRNA2_202624_c0_seq1.p1  ORF type:complete len:343 (+),score=25.29 gnl/TRDRNA2_/TRDRNA2_202624_c0_seq1:101-1030(+)
MVDGLHLDLEWHHYTLAIFVSLQFVYNFTEACFREPGYVSNVAGESTGHFPIVATCEQGGVETRARFAPRWCQYCRNWKPPRAHHSKQVGRCVLRMDHYCVTTENVVGARNHGHFVLMVAYGGFGLLYGLLMVILALAAAWKPYWQLFERMRMLAARHGEGFIFSMGPLHCFTSLVGGEVLIFVMVDFIALYLIHPLARHVRRASYGLTFIETISLSRDRGVIELPSGRQGAVPLGAFSRGSKFDNLRAILGPRWRWRLLCPVRGRMDEIEETCPTLASDLADQLRHALASAGKGNGDAAPAPEQPSVG